MSEDHTILHSIERALTKLQEVLQKLIESISKHDQTEQSNKQQKPQVSINPEVRLPVEITEYYRSEQGERRIKNRHERIRICLDITGVAVAVLLLIAAVITAVIFYGQLQEAKEQTRVFKRQADQAKLDAAQQLSTAKVALLAEQNRFVKDQRPYIWSNSVAEPDQPRMTAGQVVTWNWHYTVYGKTPAIGAAGREQVIWGPRARSQLVKNFFSAVHKPNDESGTVIPPGKDMYSSAHSFKNNPSAQDIEWIKTHDGGIMLVAYFEYFDNSGSLYKSTICMERLATGAIADCKAFTKIE